MGTKGLTRVDDLLRVGREALDARRFDRAERHLRTAARLDPADARAGLVLGALLCETDRATEAVEVLERTARLVGPLAPETTSVYNNLANALRRAERYDEAEAYLRRLVAVSPREWQPWHNLGQLLKETGRLDEAAAALRRAVALAPEHAQNHAVLGAVLHQLDRLHSAQVALERAIALGYDDDVNVWTMLGNNSRFLGDRDHAVAALERALHLAGESPAALSNMGIILTPLGRFEEALAFNDRAIAIEPDNDLWYANRGYARLTAGSIPEGWHDWEHAIRGGSRGSERPLGVPRWTPDDRDVRVLCYREQGVGDEILFASCYPDLIAAVRETVVECDPRLVSLFARSFPGAEVRAQSYVPGIGETMHDVDRAIPAGSLPLHFRPTFDHFPRERRSFLVPDPERVARWRERVEPIRGPAVVGIAWRSRLRTAERRLEYTRLADDWGPLFAIPDVTWLNLQYDDCERELRAAEHAFGVTIHRWESVDYMNDFEEVAALMTACDLVVAPRNAVAMLAGALGVPTVMMGNRWDWSDLGTDTSPWFPSIELAYRHFGGSWGPVIGAAAARVATTTRRAPRAQGEEGT